MDESGICAPCEHGDHGKCRASAHGGRLYECACKLCFPKASTEDDRVRAAVAAEREACAKIADGFGTDPAELAHPCDIAAAIRARSGQTPTDTAAEHESTISNEPVCGYSLSHYQVCALTPGHDNGVHERGRIHSK